MPSKAGEILADIRDTLRAIGSFASVTTGPDRDAARWPRAEVQLVSIEQSPADDRAGRLWTCLRARLCLHVSAPEQGSALERAMELTDAAQQALRVDRFRNQRCRDLPVGLATELGPARVEPNVKSPYLAMSFEIRCHFESEGGP